MSAAACEVEGELEIETPHGVIRCVGSGHSFDLVFRNLTQLIRATAPVRSGPAVPVAGWMLAAAAQADIDVKLRIGKQVVGRMCLSARQDRPVAKLKVLKMVAAAFSTAGS